MKYFELKTMHQNLWDIKVLFKRKITALYNYISKERLKVKFLSFYLSKLEKKRVAINPK